MSIRQEAKHFNLPSSSGKGVNPPSYITDFPLVDLRVYKHQIDKKKKET